VTASPKHVLRLFGDYRARLSLKINGDAHFLIDSHFAGKSENRKAFATFGGFSHPIQSAMP
jgi:hypothetical protein